MRRRFLGVLLAGIAAGMLPVMAATHYVVLSDGTWLPAAGEPIEAGGKARIPLRGGMVAVIDADHVDWTASKKYTEAGEQPKGPHAVPGKGAASDVVFTNATSASTDGGQARRSAPTAPSAPVAPAAPAAPPAPSSARQVASLHARIATLDEQISTLEGQAGDLRSQMGNQWNLDEKAKLNQQLETVETQLGQLREQKESLLTELWSLQQP